MYNMAYTLSIPVITVQFQPSAYVVNEGEQVVFRVVLSSASDSDMTVEFNTVDGSASGIISGGSRGVQSLGSKEPPLCSLNNEKIGCGLLNSGCGPGKTP